MAQGSTCATPIKGNRMRMVKVDSCGIPVTGASTSLIVVSSGFVQVQQSHQYEDGEEFFEKNANGDACVNQKDDPVLKRINLTIDLCEIDPTMATYMMSARDIVSGSPSSGYGWIQSEGTPTNRFTLEVWQKIAGSSACDAQGAQRYIYHAWPNVGAVQVGDYTIENGRSTLQFTAETRGAHSLWGYGPTTAKWLPSTAAVSAAGIDHWAWAITSNAPPAAVCGGQAWS